MKRITAWILAALFTASAFTACTTTPADGETDTAKETSETVVDIQGETITENGEAKAHIVVAEGSDGLLTYAAEELVYHIQKVSGATVSVVGEASTEGLAIVIATPDTCPELETLFPEDITWLSTLKEDGKQYSDDGFAIRRLDKAIYIFGMTPRGALNGVYDFIEENMGVLWVRANEDLGLIYEEMPTIAADVVDYREKSPFETRGWHTCGIGYHGETPSAASDEKTLIMMSRNKLNAKFAELGNAVYWNYYKTIGLEPFFLGHYMKHWVTSSPIYDHTVTEYWNTDEEGVPLNVSTSTQVNYWSELTADTIAAGVIDFLSKNDTDTVGIGVEDNDTCVHLPESAEPFEYAPGQFVEPGDPAYISTVYFTFLNRIARQVKEAYPDVTINTFAYWLVEAVPLCEIEDNVTICIAPILEDMSDPLTDPDNAENARILAMMEQWKDLPNDLKIYNYYGCSFALERYERPIWDRIQSDFRYYVEAGIEGTVPEGLVDATFAGSLHSQTWAINSLTFWLYSKLAWNPEEDIDALIVEFCDKVYGAASEHMQEYYRLIEYGWNESEEADNNLWNFKLEESFYFETFVYQLDLESDIIAALRAAYDAADTDVIKERIRPIKESFEEEFPEV